MMIPMKLLGLVVGVLGAVLYTWAVLIMAVRSAFFPDIGIVKSGQGPVIASSAINPGESKPPGQNMPTKRTPSEEATGQVRPTPNPGYGPEPPIPRPGPKESDPARIEPKKSDLERLTESHNRKLADLKRGLVGPAVRVATAANTMEAAVRKFRADEQIFETEMGIRNKNPILNLPNPPIPQLPDPQQILGLDSAITEFEKAIAGYNSASKEAVFEFYRQTKGITRQGEAERDWIGEALELDEVSNGLFLCHARQRLVDMYHSGRFDLWPNLEGVAPASFTYGCVKSINQARFTQDRSYTPCFIDKALLIVAQDHAQEMARVDKNLPKYVVDDPGVSKRLGGVIPVEAINSFCNNNEKLPPTEAAYIRFLLKQESGAVLLSQESRVGVGICKSKTGKWYFSLLMAPR